MTAMKTRSTALKGVLIFLVALALVSVSYAAKEDEKSETKAGAAPNGMEIDQELRHLFTEMMSLNHHRQTQDHENLFDAADKDSNGHIDRNEFEAFVKSNQDMMDNFQMRRHGPEHVFKRNDLDKDGSLNKREWARTSHIPHYMPHFVNPNMWKNPLEIVYQTRGMHSPKVREDHATQVFEEIDLNKDGKIDEMELKATYSRIPEMSMNDPHDMMGPMGPMGPMGSRRHEERRRRMMDRADHERRERIMERPEHMKRDDRRRVMDRNSHRNEFFDQRIEHIQKRIQEILQEKASRTFQQLDKNNDKILDKNEWNEGSVVKHDEKLMSNSGPAANAKDAAQATDKKQSTATDSQAKPPTPKASQTQQPNGKDIPVMKSA